MNQILRAADALTSLSVFRGILNRPCPQALYRLLLATDGPKQDFFAAWGTFFSVLCEEGGCSAMARCITSELLYDDNAFSRAAAAGECEFSPELTTAVQRDLAAVRAVAQLSPNEILAACRFSEASSLRLPKWTVGEPVPELLGSENECAEKLAAYYRQNGCGIFSRYRAFLWREREIRPVLHPDATRLSDLKGYEIQRGLAIQNTEAFLAGLPANNCLLYGDRGTGKSSTVKALLNEYASKGLRMIEVPKESLTDFPLLVDQIAPLPMKFIIFIDDLTFNREDDTYSSLKAVLEGGLAARPENTLIYATSNRRHLVRETFSEREGDEIHRGDSIQESLSLADRFGLSISFTLPGRDQYLQIVHRLAEQRGLAVGCEALESGAEKWAIARGGRSPRCAKQYIRNVEARLKWERSSDDGAKGDTL
jgi:predicted AAA+ superfamily ATPase